MKNKEQVYPKAFYNRKIVQKAIADYRHIANIELTENRTHLVCKFRKCIVDEQRVCCEFNNYLIELLNSQGDDIEA